MDYIFQFNPPPQDSEEVTGDIVKALGNNTLNLITLDLQKSNISDILLKKRSIFPNLLFSNLAEDYVIDQILCYFCTFRNKK